MNKEKQSLINQSAELYEMIGYPPTAGQIMGLLYVSDQKYFTFQELLDSLKISKSAVSKSLNFLLAINEISFKTKDNNKRKRYFYISKKGTVKSMEDWLKSLFVRKELLEKILSTRTEENSKFNHLIKQQIAFIKDVAPFFEQKIKEHFA